MLSASVLAAVPWWITPFAAWQAAIVALTANAMGIFGGLVLPAIKRDRGVKDWGTMIGGHGGMPGRAGFISSARRDLCGGRGAILVSTATA